MTGEFVRTSLSSNRREFLGGLSTVTIILIAGCGNTEGDETKERTTSGESPDIGEQRGEDVLLDEIEVLESVYDSLSNLPVVEGDEFVFDVKQFEEEFDYESLISQVKSFERTLDSAQKERSSPAKVDTLESIAQTTKLLVRQRVLIHQIIAASLTCERRFYEAEIEESIEASEHAREYLSNLKAVGEEIKETMPESLGAELDIDGYDPATIKRTQEMLANIVLWSGPVYEGIYRITRGMRQFTEGNSGLEGDRYEEARTGYRNSKTHFERAQEAFDVAQGRGTKLPYLVPFVERLRCILPAYVSSSGKLAESMLHLQSGNDTRGKKIARDAINSADQIASRCIRGQQR